MSELTTIDPITGVDVTARSSNGIRFWSKARLKAKALLLEGKSEREVAALCTRDRSWVQQLKRKPEFKAAVDAYYANLNAELMTYGYGNKVNRIASLNETARTLHEREQSQGIGMRVTKYDKDGNLLEERETVDKDMLSEKRAALRAIAEETGQLRDVDSAGTTVLIREINIQVGGLL